MEKATLPAPAIEPSLSPHALEVLRARYLKKDGTGRTAETPAEMFARVATAVAEAERMHGANPETAAESFYEAMVRLEFLPNSPTLMNAGTGSEQLAACFVLPVDDSLDGIFSGLREAALVHQTGGGVGYDFSHLRPRGDWVTSSAGASSGPVSFITVFDAAVDVVRQGGRRRGANMAVLNVHHPDVEEFITAKREPGALRNFNLSVGVDDEFMAAAAGRRQLTLVNPRTGEAAGTRDAGAILDLIAESAWASGDPGLVFLDRINRDNPTPALGRITATNPCGEVPLLPHEACILGSMNLSSLTAGGSFDWARLDQLTDLGIRFLDDCVDASVFPLPQIAAAVHCTRKIGLGVMGFADALVDLGIPYDSDAAIGFAHELMARVAARATEASRILARTRGPFPAFAHSRAAATGAPPIRNATRIAIAPTGTLSLIAGCSSGIEPFFALAYERHVLEGRTLEEVNARFEAAARRAGAWTPDARAHVLESGRARGWPGFPSTLRALFPTAYDIPAEQHIRIQAAFQAHVDNAVSKTVNVPAETTAPQVRDAYRRAFELGCKGVTVYRHGTRTGQVLTLCGACAPTTRP